MLNALVHLLCQPNLSRESKPVNYASLSCSFKNILSNGLLLNWSRSSREILQSMKMHIVKGGLGTKKGNSRKQFRTYCNFLDCEAIFLPLSPGFRLRWCQVCRFWYFKNLLWSGRLRVWKPIQGNVKFLRELLDPLKKMITMNFH